MLKSSSINEGSMNYESRRTLDLVHQILSDSSNVYQEEKNMFDLFRVYGRILTRWTNNKDFEKSMITSIQSLPKPYEKSIKEIMDLKNDDPNSFIIKTMNATGHRFASVIRKQKGDYSITLINKGLRPGYQFEEFIIKPKNLNNLLKSLNSSIYSIPTEKIYEIFSNNAEHRYCLNLSATNQKTGNCFVKNPENAIKFAYSTKDFSQKEFHTLRLNDPKKTFALKWGVATSGVHRLFVEQLQRENPTIKEPLGELLEIYDRNKNFREFCQKNPTSILKNLYMAFDPYHKLNPNDSNNTIRLFSQINNDTATKLLPQLTVLLNKLDKSENLAKTFFNVTNLNSIIYNNKYFEKENFGQLANILNNGGQKFPVLVNNLQRELHGSYFSQACAALQNDIDTNLNKSLDYTEKANQLYKFDSKTYFFEGLVYLYMGDDNSNNNLKKAERNYLNSVDSLTSAIELKPQDANAYYLRGYVYDKLKENKKSQKDLEMANRTGRDSYPETYKDTQCKAIYQNIFNKTINKNLPKPSKKQFSMDFSM